MDFPWTLKMPRLPDLQMVGGNARPAHWAQGARARREAKEAWIWEIRALGIPPMPQFSSAHAKVTLVFKEHRNRDVMDNLAISLKGLWDALQHWEILVNDCPPFLYVDPIQVKVDPARAPLTILELRGELVE